LFLIFCYSKQEAKPISMTSASNKDEMSFLDHLEELRWHLIRSVLAIVIVATVAFIFKDFIFDVLLFGQRTRTL
jgi:sec-independent protein translocase protein TatC